MKQIEDWAGGFKVYNLPSLEGAGAAGEGAVTWADPSWSRAINMNPKIGSAAILMEFILPW